MAPSFSRYREDPKLKWHSPFSPQSCGIEKANDIFIIKYNKVITFKL